MPRVVTGIQATGTIHLGNYVGAIRPVIDLQHSDECYVFIADLHALNGHPEPDRLAASVLEIAKAYLACGLDPDRVTLFRQSAVPGHAELAVMLAPHAGHGLLERAHAYKDAQAKNKPINAGLYFYPVLMAADILLYKGEAVPVGADQQQHLEMTREIAEKFNHQYGELFPLPQPILMGGEEHLLKGLDGRKMSKSYDNVIGLFDDPETIRAKCAKIVTDSKAPDEPKDPLTDTIFSIFRHVAPTPAVEELEGRYREGGVGYKEAKELLAEAVISFTTPMREKRAALTDDHAVRELLRQGAERAETVAQATLREAREHSGLLP